MKNFLNLIKKQLEIAKIYLINLLIFLILFYKKVISPFLPKTCRFHPTCSSYCKEAIEKYGFFGFILAIKRLSRCHPWHPGGFDPVP